MDPKHLELIAVLVGFVEGDGPVPGLWARFIDWATDIEHGYEEEDFDEAIAALKRATGRSA